MTASKLTAKLSDGTEWEVLSYRGQAFGKRDGISYKDETIGLELKPLKNGPPKEVFLELPGEKEFQHIRSYSFDSTTTGGKYTRYVLAPEHDPEIKAAVKKAAHQFLDKKQAREWWCVYDHNHRMHVMFEQYAAAVANFTAAPLDRNSPFLVREVLG